MKVYNQQFQNGKTISDIYFKIKKAVVSDIYLI